MSYTTKSIMKNKNKCKENWETLPYSSEHVWRADHHGVASGDCQKCGHPYAEWSRKLKNMLDPNVPKLPLSKKSMMSKAIPPAKGEWAKDFDNKFGFEEYYVCKKCGHGKEQHFWNGGGRLECSGYDACLVEKCDCNCLSEELDIKRYPVNQEVKSFIRSTRSQAYEEGYRKGVADEIVTAQETYIMHSREREEV